MKYTYYPKGVCAARIDFELNGDRVENVSFQGGCSGNLKAISALVEGMTVEEIGRKLSGNVCGLKNTSCADQLVKGLYEALEAEKK